MDMLRAALLGLLWLAALPFVGVFACIKGIWWVIRKIGNFMGRAVTFCTGFVGEVWLVSSGMALLVMIAKSPLHLRIGCCVLVAWTIGVIDLSLLSSVLPWPRAVGLLGMLQQLAVEAFAVVVTPVLGGPVRELLPGALWFKISTGFFGAVMAFSAVHLYIQRWVEARTRAEVAATKVWLFLGAAWVCVLLALVAASLLGCVGTIDWYIRLGIEPLAGRGYCAAEDLRWFALGESKLLNLGGLGVELLNLGLGFLPTGEATKMQRLRRQLIAGLHPDKHVAKSALVKECYSQLFGLFSDTTERAIKGW